MVRSIFVGLGLAVAAFAQSSTYTGPMFNPSDAPFFGPSSLVIPTLTQNVPTTLVTPTTIRSRTVSTGSVSHSTLSSVASRSSSASASASESESSSSASRTTTPTHSASKSSTASASSPAQSSGAASLNYPGVMGVVAGGLVAGLAMV